MVNKVNYNFYSSYQKYFENGAKVTWGRPDPNGMKLMLNSYCAGKDWIQNFRILLVLIFSMQTRFDMGYKLLFFISQCLLHSYFTFISYVNLSTKFKVLGK